MPFKTTSIVLLFFVIFVAIPSAHADPCGMVPPITPGQETPIARVGLQQTYVFYKDGVETFVIRPGFTGKVDEFGMLIPFPTPPAIRKVPDHIFPHIAAAVDPPEVIVNLRRGFLGNFSRPANAKKPSAPLATGALGINQVKVLRQEAVGMYEVTVLATGSAQALKKWMDDHKYQYPTGMDAVCEDYVELGWCFVAVKTKVGQKKGADPKPGQRQVNTKLPDGSSFDGHVQGMGFRFRVDKLIVPMRLSAFNDGELRNVVYLMTDGPRKIRSIPEEYVVRQISGAQLIKNLTDPLPLRIIGGTEKDIPDYRRRTLPQERNPVPKNGAARDLFAADLLAVKTEGLALPHEEQEKVLLRIGERFGLRGADIDKLNADALAQARDKIVKDALAELKGMTLTIVDGDFPRELLAKQNLTFAQYRMPRKRNNATSYDAKLNAPGRKQQGVLKTGRLDRIDNGLQEDNPGRMFAMKPATWISAGLLLLNVKTRARKGTGSVPQNGSKPLEKVASRCQSPFSRTITNSVGPSGKWDRHQGSDLGKLQRNIPRAASEPVPFSQLPFHFELLLIGLVFVQRRVRVVS